MNWDNYILPSNAAKPSTSVIPGVGISSCLPCLFVPKCKCRCRCLASPSFAYFRRHGFVAACEWWWWVAVDVCSYYAAVRRRRGSVGQLSYGSRSRAQSASSENLSRNGSRSSGQEQGHPLSSAYFVFIYTLGLHFHLHFSLFLSLYTSTIVISIKHGDRLGSR